MKYNWFSGDTGEGRKTRRNGHSRQNSFGSSISACPFASSSTRRRVRDALKVSARLGTPRNRRSTFLRVVSPLQRTPSSAPYYLSFILSSADLSEIAHRGDIPAKNLLILQARRAREARDTKSHLASLLDENFINDRCTGERREGRAAVGVKIKNLPAYTAERKKRSSACFSLSPVYPCSW